MEGSIGLEELLMFANEIEGDDANEQQAQQAQQASEAAGSQEAGSSDDTVPLSSGFEAEEVELLQAIGEALSEAMSVEVSDMDLNEELSDEEHQELMFSIFDKVLKAVKLKGNTELDAADLAYVKSAVEKEAVKRGLQQPPPTKPRRFAPLDRVVCRVARGDRLWAAGSVQALDQENDAVDPYKTFPYMVKVDPPDSFGFSCPDDTDACVRAEVINPTAGTEPNICCCRI